MWAISSILIIYLLMFIDKFNIKSVILNIYKNKTKEKQVRN